MKKRILSIILTVGLLFLLTGCNYSAVETEEKEDTPSMFVCVETAPAWAIIYHKDTKVMYAVSRYGSGSGEFTLLVNADGTPMTWEE